jgi:hypothetical protein
MKKQIICALAAILIASINKESAAQKIRLLKKTHLTNYPSASSLEFYKEKLYVIGDDAPSIWILDKNHSLLDSIVLFPSKEKRIDWAIKADLESSTIITKNDRNYLVAFSSFSTPTRNKIIFLSLDGPEKILKQVETTLEATTVQEPNIEGAACIGHQLILSNRANTTHKNNSLLLTTIDTTSGINKNYTVGINKNYTVITLYLPKTKKVTGISGISYLKEKDMLLFTASTENTPNAYTDGEIGASYIGYVKYISKKLTGSSIKADKLISVSKYLGEKSAQKIESLTVEEIKGKKVIIHLAADNDNGESTLFKLELKL